MVVCPAIGSPVSCLIIDSHDEVEVESPQLFTSYENQFFGIGPAHAFLKDKLFNQVLIYIVCDIRLFLPRMIAILISHNRGYCGCNRTKHRATPILISKKKRIIVICGISASQMKPSPKRRSLS
jgi:hypothetical protein